MESVVRAIAKQEWLLVIRALVEVVPEFVMDGGEIVGVDLDAHFHAQIVGRINIPCRRVAHYFAVARMHKLRTLPERPGQRSESQRFAEVLAIMHHLFACRETGGVAPVGTQTVSRP